MHATLDNVTNEGVIPYVVEYHAGRAGNAQTRRLTTTEAIALLDSQVVQIEEKLKKSFGILR